SQLKEPRYRNCAQFGTIPLMTGQKTKEISVSMPSRMFRRLMFFNRFSHERIRPMWILYFGLADEADYLLDFYACSVDEATIERAKDELLSFAGRATTPVPDNIAPWRPKVSTITGFEVA